MKYVNPSGHDPKCGPDGILCGYDGSGYAGGTGSGGGGDNNSGSGPSVSGGTGDESAIPVSYTHQNIPLAYLENYSQYQGETNFCGAYSIAIAANLFSASCGNATMGSVVADELWWHSQLGMGIPPRYYAAYLQSNIPNGVISHHEYATIVDLKYAIAQDEVVIVAISWETTAQVLRKGLSATVGHYMVAVGYDENNIHFLDPGANQGRVQTWPYDTVSRVLC